MARVLAVADIIEARISCKCNEQASVNVVHYYVVSNVAVPLTDAQAATGIAGAVDAAYVNLISNQAQFVGVSVQVISAVPLPARQIDDSFGATGAVAGNAMPRQSAGVLSTSTALAGRKYRGRIYVPFPGTGDNQAGGQPVAGYVTRLNALGALIFVQTGYVLGGGTLTLRPLIYHRATKTYDAITAYEGQQKWATQRRRGTYGRPNTAP